MVKQHHYTLLHYFIQKFSFEDLFGKCKQISRKLHICSNLLKKSSTGTFIFCTVLKKDETPKYIFHSQFFIPEFKVILTFELFQLNFGRNIEARTLEPDQSIYLHII